MWLRKIAPAILPVLLCVAAQAADSDREQVVAIVARFARSWETGDLAQFESTLDDKLL